MTTSNTYLDAKVLGAPPYRLRLLLIEGAIRFGRQAELELERGDTSAADAPLSRVVDILGEIVASLRSIESEIGKRLASFYMFLFRTVCEARVNGDVAKIREALDLLEYERDTWQLVCDTMSSGRTAATPPTASSATIEISPAAPSRLSLEA